MLIHYLAVDIYYIFMFFTALSNVLVLLLLFPSLRSKRYSKFLVGCIIVSLVFGGIYYVLHSEDQDMQNFVQVQDALEKPQMFCAVASRVWSVQEGGGGNFMYRDPITTVYRVGYQKSDGSTGSAQIPASLFGALREGQEITVSHQKTDLVKGLSGIPVWVDIVSIGCKNK